MRGCNRCTEIEQLLERTASEHWNAIHQYKGATNPGKDPDTIARILAGTKAAMDEAQAMYDQHLAAVHPELKAG